MILRSVLTSLLLLAAAPTAAMQIEAQATMPQSEQDRLTNRLFDIASWNGDPGEAQQLIAAGANINAQNLAHELAKNETVLTTAARNHSNKIINVLLAAGANVEAKNGYRQTPLIAAFRKDTSSRAALRTIKILLEHGANANAQDDQGFTALMYASCQDSLYADEICEALLAHDANPNIISKNGSTALTCALACKDERIYQMLMKHGAHALGKSDDWPETLVFIVDCDKNDAWQARYAALLTLGANINAQDKKGRTALIIAAERNLVETCKFFVQSGANLHIKTIHQETVLLELAQTQSYEKINYEKRETICKFIVNHQKEQEHNMITLLASLKHSEMPIAQFLYRHRNELLTRYLEQYLLRTLLTARDCWGCTAYDSWKIDWLKP